MAGCVQLAALIFLATLAVIEPSTSLYRVTNGQKNYELTKDNSMQNFSEETSRWAPETPRVETFNTPPWAPESNEDIILTKPPGRNSGSRISTSPFMIEENIPENEDKTSNVYPHKNKKKADGLDMDNKMGQTPSSGTVVTTSQELRQTHFKLHPTVSKVSESDTKNKTGNKVPHEEPMELTHVKPSSQIGDDLQLKNNVEIDNLGGNDIKVLTTVHPTVSTITLMSTLLKSYGEDGPFTPIHKLQIDSGDVQVTKELLKNSLESPIDPATSQGPKVTIEDNFLDDNTIPKVYEVQPTQRYQAAFRTTDGYSTLQDTEPESNEVISAEIEFPHEDGAHYQKDGNTIFEESITLGNDTEDQYLSPFAQSKEIIDAIIQVTNKELSAETSDQPQPPTSLPTLQPYVMENDLLPATVDITEQITMEAKARTETERILVIGGGQLISSEKTSLQSKESPTPVMQVLGKDPDKVYEAEKPYTQPGKVVQITQRNPIIGSAPPGLVMSTTWKMLVTKKQDPVLDISRSEGTSTTKESTNGTRKNGRRGEIRVTTQRALHRPQLIDVPTYYPSKKPTLDTPMCSKNSGTCEFLGANKTLIKWDDLQRTLSFAWEMHVYGTGALFLLLSVIALINLIGSPILQVSYLPYVILANALLFVIGILRGVFFFLDPYGTKMKIAQPIALVLYNVTFPLMLTAFATLVLLVLKISHLQVLPPKFQSLALLAVIAVIHFIVLLSADLLTHLLNPSVNMVLQILSISWGIFLMVGNFVAYYQLRKGSKEIVNETRVSPTEDIVVVQTQRRSIKCIFTSSRVLLVGSIFGLLCCALQVYAILWLYGLLGRKNEFSWSWWFLQFWFRIFELALCFSMIFVASHSFCLQCSNNDHTCWSKIISYFCTYKKSDVPEYPNNCYDWTNSIQDRMVNNNISKSLIRNHAENVPLKILKENNETKSGTVGNNSQSSSPLFKPKPDSAYAQKSQNVTMGRSYTSICFEKESMLSLTDLEFRPPSPINLSRSIDEALFREHLVRDSIFLDSSLQYPSYLTRQDSCSSLKECSAMNQTIDPLISSDLKMRRCSNPDYMYSMAKGSSTTEVDSPSESLQQSKELPRDLTTDAVVSVSSMDSVSKGSIKISWNPWRHGRSSVESLPLEDAPTTQLLKQGSQPSIMSKSSEPEKSIGRRLIERSQTTDSHSIASETIEL